MLKLPSSGALLHIALIRHRTMIESRSPGKKFGLRRVYIAILKMGSCQKISSFYEVKQ